MYEANKAFQMFSLTFSGKNRRERAIADAADEGFITGGDYMFIPT